MLIELNYPLDRTTLLKEANEIRGYVPFKAHEGPISAWLIKVVSKGYAKEATEAFAKLIGSDTCRSQFYRQAPGYHLNFHRDYGTLCSLNVLLSENPEPISFETGDVYYRTALLDTQSLHAVKNATSTRVLFKMSVFDRTFDEVAQILRDHELNAPHIAV